MKKLFMVTSFALALTTLSLSTSCNKEEEYCYWYVDDDMGILTGYTTESNCKSWAALWDDVTCTEECETFKKSSPINGLDEIPADSLGIHQAAKLEAKNVQ